MMTKQQMADAFHTALKDENWESLKRLCTDDACWLLPGENMISSPVMNANALIARACLIASYHMKFHLRQVLVSQLGFALYQFNSAGQGNNKFEQHVTTICRMQDDKINQIETFVSDLDEFNLFFNTKPMK